jgi:sphinganine-1-phosphate aldolase
MGFISCLKDLLGLPAQVLAVLPITEE